MRTIWFGKNLKNVESLRCMQLTLLEQLKKQFGQLKKQFKLHAAKHSAPAGIV